MQYVSPNLKFVSEPIFLETSPDGESLLFNVYSALIFKLLSNLVPGCLVILSILNCVCSMNGSVRISGGVGGVEPPYLILPTPLPLVKIRPRGVEFHPPT